MIEPTDLTSSQAEALLVLNHCFDRPDGVTGFRFAYSSTSNDLDRRAVVFASAQVLVDLGLASEEQHGISQTWVFTATGYGREVAGRLCRIHSPHDEACGETEECPS